MTAPVKITNLTAGAPTLTGAEGSLIAVLDFALVTTLGWVKSFSTTNVATYRAPAGNRFYFAVNDSAELNTRVRAFESATTYDVAVASGSGPYPTDAQQSGGLYYYKSNDTGTAREWVIVGDDKCFYMTNPSTSAYSALFFGDFISHKAGDAFNSCISADTATATATAFATTTVTLTTSSGVFCARPFTQIGGSVACGKGADPLRSSGSTTMGNGGTDYPSPIDGGLIMSPVYIVETTSGIRGKFPGLWNPCHTRPLNNADTFSGSGALAGKNFLARHLSSSAQMMLETSDTWYD